MRRAAWRGGPPQRPCSGLTAICGGIRGSLLVDARRRGEDGIDRRLWLRNHRDMRCGDLGDRGTGPYRHRALRVGWDDTVVGAHDRRELVPHGPLLLTADQWLGEHLPERVLVVGRLTLSRAAGALLRNPAVAVEIVAAQSIWPDPSHAASVVHPFEAVRASITNSRQVDEKWAKEWADAGGLVAKAAGPFIDQTWPSGLAIAETVLTELPPGATLFVGSSNSARDVDLAMSPSSRSAPLTIVASRGLAGIDGCVSTAIGLSLAQPGQPAYALMGDLTFLHDSNGLVIGPHEPQPDLTIVVTNDDGGGIFTLLEPGEPSRAADYERIFGTPTGASIVDICRAHGVGHTLVSTAAELGSVLRQSPEGLRVVEVRIDRSGHRGLHAGLRSAAANALR